MSGATPSIPGGWFYTRLAIGIGFVGLILWGCVTPNPPSTGWPEFDKVEHVGSMAWLALWFGLLFYRQLTQVALWVALYGVVIEVVHTYLVASDGDIFDFGADCAGMLIGIGAALVLLRAWRKRCKSLLETESEEATELQETAELESTNKPEETTKPEEAAKPQEPAQDSAKFELTPPEPEADSNARDAQKYPIGDKDAIEAGLAETRVDSMVLCGSNSSSQSSLARHMAESLGWHYLEIDGRNTGIGRIRKAFDQAVEARRNGWNGVILFVDAIDQLSFVALDALLICSQDGALVLIGGADSDTLSDDDMTPLSRLPRYTVQSS